MNTQKIIFLGSKPIGYNCFEHLLKKAAELNIEVIGLLTKTRTEFGEGSDLTALAAEHDIPVLENQDEIPECDIIYSIQYHKILKSENFKKARHAAVNLHLAPLPEYRGCNQFSHALLDKKMEFGSTIHMIDERIDHGDILFQSRFLIPYNAWVEDLYNLTIRTATVLFKETLPDLVAGKYERIPQETLEAKYGTSLHYRNEIEELKQIDLNWDREKIERHIRATYMPGFEPPYTIIDGKKIHFSVAAS